MGGGHLDRHRAGRPRRSRHPAPRGRSAAARPRTGAGITSAAGRSRLGGGVGQGRVPRSPGPRRRTRAGGGPPPARHRHRGSSPAPCRLRGDRRTVSRSASSPAATSRRCSTTASPSPSSRRTCADGTEVEHRRARHVPARPDRAPRPSSPRSSRSRPGCRVGQLSGQIVPLRIRAFPARSGRLRPDRGR